MKPSLSILVGSTASGKSSLAIEWARRTGGWILSCDALLFYRGADIGTAKPTAKEREAHPHFGIDLCEPAESYNVSRYIEYALEVLERANEGGVPVLAVGGSGFYASSFNDAPPDPIAVPESIRTAVRRLEAESGREGLKRRLLELDPQPDIDLNNPRRLAPALERCLTTGLTTSQLRKKQKSIPCPFEKWDRKWFLVDRPTEELQRRIHFRTKTMIEEGLIDETVQLKNQGMLQNPTLSSAIGYREILEYLEGKLTLSEVPNLISLHTEQLASRQKKWIKKRLPEARLIYDARELGN